MLTFQSFDQWHSVLGFFTVALFFFIFPNTNGNSIGVKVVLFIGIGLALVVPFLVEVTPKEHEKLLMRSAKIVHTIIFVVVFYCYYSRDVIQKNIPYFFWFCYGLGVYSLMELLLTDVLLAAKYQFVTILFPWLQSQLGIQNFNFTAPINYLIKFIFLGLFFRDSLQNQIWKKVFQYAVWVLLGFELVQVFIFKSYQGYDSLSSTVKNIFILSGAGLLLYRVYASQNVSLSLQKNAYFWICLGLILPALAELFLEFIFNKLYETDQLSFYKLYLVRNASQMVGFTLLIVGVWQAKYLRFLPKEF